MPDDSTTAAHRTMRSSRPLSLAAVVSTFRRGGGDPTSHSAHGASWWFAWRTAQGPVTLHLAQGGVDTPVTARAWGEGSDWMLEQLPDLLGENDDASGFVAHHELVAEAAKRFAGWRMPRSGLVLQALIPSIIEQKVTGQEAFAGYRRLVRSHGTPAPGPGAALRLVVPPEPQGWARIPSWEWVRAGMDGGRSAPAVRAATRAGRIEECAGLPADQARRRLEALPGVGRWTSAEVAHRALGDADAVSFGDYHVAKNIGWALTGEPIDDDALAELLAPYAGHRYRVQRLLELGGFMRPRRGPRMAPRTHLPG